MWCYLGGCYGFLSDEVVWLSKTVGDVFFINTDMVCGGRWDGKALACIVPIILLAYCVGLAIMSDLVGGYCTCIGLIKP